MLLPRGATFSPTEIPIPGKQKIEAQGLTFKFDRLGIYIGL